MSFTPDRVLVPLFGLALVLGLFQAVPATAAAPPESTQEVRPIASKPWAKHPRSAGERAKSVRLQAPKWPAKSTATVGLPSGSWARATKGAWLRSSDRQKSTATVTSLGRIDVAGRPGVGYAVETSKASSQLTFKLDYSSPGDSPWTGSVVTYPKRGG